MDRPIGTMGKPKGYPKTGGRKAGVPNVRTRTMALAIEQAFEQLGGVEFLVRTGRKKPEVFCYLLGRLLPKEIKAEVSLTIGLADRLRLACQRSGVPEYVPQGVQNAPGTDRVNEG